jgi:hypothetical protein
MKEVEAFLHADMNITGTPSGIGIYFDAPGTVSVENQRSIVGYILTEEQYNSFPEENSKGVEKASFPAFEAVYSAFPYKGAPSFMFAVAKIYPAFDKYISDNSFIPNASIEIYDMENKTIEIYMPIDIEYREIEVLFGV